MSTPQEIQVWYILPALRREITKCMLEKGLKQKEIARKLNVTEATISQYLKNKRAKEVEFSKEVIKKIKEAVHKMLNENTCVMKELISLCKESKQECCKLHKQKDNIKCECGVCYL